MLKLYISQSQCVRFVFLKNTTFFTKSQCRSGLFCLFFTKYGISGSPTQILKIGPRYVLRIIFLNLLLLNLCIIYLYWVRFMFLKTVAMGLFLAKYEIRPRQVLRIIFLNLLMLKFMYSPVILSEIYVPKGFLFSVSARHQRVQVAVHEISCSPIQILKIGP